MINASTNQNKLSGIHILNLYVNLCQTIKSIIRTTNQTYARDKNQTFTKKKKVRTFPGENSEYSYWNLAEAELLVSLF